MDQQLFLGQQLLESVDDFTVKLDVKIRQKLKRRIAAELKFLKQLNQRIVSGEIQHADSISAVNSSNLPFLRGVLDVAKAANQVTGVLTHFCSHDVSIDVVCERGHKWVKVIARNPQALHLVWAGKGQYGDRDLLKKAAKYVTSAKKYCSVRPPQLEFYFCCAVTHQMSERLQALGITVVGQRVDVAEEVSRRLSMLTSEFPSDDSDDCYENEDESVEPEHSCSLAQSSTTEEVPALWLHSNQVGFHSACPASCLAADAAAGNRALWDGAHVLSYAEAALTSSVLCIATPRLFLDITALIALVSELTHGGCYFEFREQALTEQAVDERTNPALPIIKHYTDGKELVTCSAASSDFVKLVSTLGGPKETARAQELLKNITIVPDCISERAHRLQISSRIKHRSKVIFGTADSVGCDILTANSGFVRAAAGQSVNLSAFLHPSRALTEKKEKTSARLLSAASLGSSSLSGHAPVLG